MRSINADIEDIQSFDQKLEILEKDILSAVEVGEQREVTLTLTEEEVSAVLVDMMREAISESSDNFSKEMIVDTMVNLDEETFRAIVRIDFAGITVDAGVELRTETDEDGLNLILESIELGRLPFPGTVKDKIRSSFNEAHTHIDFRDLHIDLDSDLPVKVTDIIVNDGEMVIIGMTT
ncbi:MAG: hypothetical protein HQ553_02650 [Chloroflexi bacterium]|nr:hypothetical protein [Chloroflexota bacterium]